MKFGADFKQENLNTLLHIFKTMCNNNDTQTDTSCWDQHGASQSEQLLDMYNDIHNLFYEHRTNPNHLSKLLDDVFKPSEHERKTYAEISTPYELRQNMLNTIPTDFWTHPHKVFEPCCGKGGFVIDVLDRFMLGLKEYEPDEEKRYRLVVEKCIYFADINRFNTTLVSLLLNKCEENKYHLNVYTGDTLKMDIQEVWSVNGFDLVVTNPPYQAVISNTGKSKGGGNNLYTKFIYSADHILNDDGYICMITPPTFFSVGRNMNQSRRNLRKDIFSTYYVHMMNINECARHFNVGSQFVYFLIQKRNEVSKNVHIICEYRKKTKESILNQSILNQLPYWTYYMTSTTLNILEKIHRYPKTLGSNIQRITLNRGDKPYVQRHQDDSHIYPIQSTGVQIVYSSKECPLQSQPKILLSRSGHLRPTYDDGKLGVGGHCVAMNVCNEVEARKWIEYFKHPLIRFYIEIHKWSGFHHIRVLQSLPYMNTFKLYETLNISLEEQEWIESIDWKI